MASPSIFLQAPAAMPACPILHEVYQTGSALEGAIFWMFLVIAIILGAGLVLYLFFVRGSYERERQAALALVGGGYERAPSGRDYPRSEPSSGFSGDVPEAVEQAMASMKPSVSGREGAEEEVELVDVEEEEGLPSYLYPDRARAPQPQRAARPPTGRPAYGGGRFDRPPGRAARGAPAQERVAGPLEDLLQEEDRQLLREEAVEPDAEIPPVWAGEEEVTFEDEPEPYTPTHFPAPRRLSTREKPAWEKVLEGRSPVYEAPIDVTPFETPEAEATAPGVGGAPAAERAEPPPMRDVISGPLADLLLEKDIMRSVREAPKRPAAGPARPAGAAPARAAPRRAEGPAWTEGRPVFSTPLVAPEVPMNRNNAADKGVEERLGDLSHRLRAMDERAGPVLPPKAEAKMGVQEKKFLEAMRAVQARKREEDDRRDEEGRRLLEEQMRELDRKKRQDEERRLAEERRKERDRLEQEQRQREEMARWEEARRSTREKMGSGESARADEERARQEAPRREEERRKREAAARQSQAATIDDVLSRIGIKK